MVLLMYAWRTHQRLSAQTTLGFIPTLVGRSVEHEANVRVDEKPANSGQRISIGWHTLSITHPRSKSFSTNLFIWYGARDLGQIPLERAKGMLAVTAEPPAQRLMIQGPEFSVSLTNTPGITSSVPTDRYVIEANYKYWKRQEAVRVSADQTVAQTFAPRLGAVRIESTHSDASYQLRNQAGELLDSGRLPTSITELLEGEFELTSRRKDDERQMTVAVKGGTTNDIKVEFVYGAAVVESDPPGAAVLSGGRQYGVTPLMLAELKPGTFEFSLRLADYESVNGSVGVTANQTNGVRTSLLRLDYTRAMASARRSFAAKDYERAAEAATEALKYRPDDSEAKALQRESTGLAHLSRAEALGQRGNYAGAIVEANAALTVLPENALAKQLLADFTKREQERIEAEQKRAAELAARQERQRRLNRLNELFNVQSQGYENATLFVRNELSTTNPVTALATAITTALTNGQPSFQIVLHSSPGTDMLLIKARHRVSIGYRECLIVAGQIGESETLILFKVFEYEQPPKTELFGGLLRMTTTVTTTTNDPKGARERAEKLQQRIKEGIAVVKERIQRAIAQIPAAKE
jgi:tetratricopeptide (TPR) repeat protein